MVFATRAFSSAKLVSLSSKRGGSWPARRAAVPLAMSVAICTWRVKVNMSGARRACRMAEGSILRSAVHFSALSRMVSRLPSSRLKTPTDALCIEMFMVLLECCRGAHHSALRADAAAIRRRAAGRRGRAAARARPAASSRSTAVSAPPQTQPVSSASSPGLPQQAQRRPVTEDHARCRPTAAAGARTRAARAQRPCRAHPSASGSTVPSALQ